MYINTEGRKRRGGHAPTLANLGGGAVPETPPLTNGMWRAP